MARRRYQSMTLPIAPIVGMVAGLASPSGQSVIEHAMAGNYVGALNRLSMNYIGYYPGAGTWNLEDMKAGLMPLIGGLVVHKVMGMLGVNKMLARARVPLIRI